jgi:hypothetical protein
VKVLDIKELFRKYMEPERSESIHQTRVLNNPSQISEQIRHMAETYSDLSIASTFGGLGNIKKERVME